MTAMSAPAYKTGDLLVWENFYGHGDLVVKYRGPASHRAQVVDRAGVNWWVQLRDLRPATPEELASHQLATLPAQL